MAAPKYSPEEERTVPVRISRSLDADYRRRGVFPMLRRTAADQLAGRSSSLLEIPEALAREALNDAQSAREAAETPRYARGAYTHLQRQLRKDLERLDRRGAIPDPGFEKAWMEHWSDRNSSPAQFKVGDFCRIWSPGSVHHNTIALIEEGFHLHSVRDLDGPYWCERERARITYRWGYVCHTPDGDSVFCPPANVRNTNGAIRHLRLATESGETAPERKVTV